MPLRILLGIFFLVIAMPHAIAADDAPPIHHGAAEARDHSGRCWALSRVAREEWSGKIGIESLDDEKDFVAAMHATLDCFKDAILGYVPKMFDPKTVSSEQMKARLVRIEGAYANFYWDIYNEHLGCFCGTQFYRIPYFEIAELYEKMLGDMLNIYRQPGFANKVEYQKTIQRIRERERQAREKSAAPK
jgi:hypothetical protein